MNQNKLKFLSILATILIPIVAIVSWSIGSDNGLKKGGLIGYNIAMDTITAVLDATSEKKFVTKLTTISRFDTNVYYISPKILTK
jgi:hypothetical protein